MEEESKIILYTTPDGKSRVSLMSRDGRVWLNQKQMAELFAVSKPNVSMLIAKILKEKELDDSVVKCYLTTAADGKKYKVIYYALEMILAIGFRVRGVRGNGFASWWRGGREMRGGHMNIGSKLLAAGLLVGVVGCSSRSQSVTSNLFFCDAFQGAAEKDVI